MPLPQASPGGERGRAFEHHRYVPTKCGSEWFAYVAGPCQWFWCHTKGRCKPCLTAMTGGELLCPRCGQITPPQVVGYLPLYRASDSRPVMVIVYECIREKVDVLPHHRRVIVKRQAQQTDSVFVVPTMERTPAFHTTMHCRQRPVDITDTLLRLWQIPELVTWYAETHGKSVNAVSLPAVAKPAEEPTQSNGKPFSPFYRNAAVRAEASVTDDVNSAMQRTLRRVKAKEAKESANGHHKPDE